ncbi:TlpA family protein disulfide reductase [Niastella vici]|nr:TlpA disulfide reductase family protein [Niastella vici]
MNKLIGVLICIGFSITGWAQTDTTDRPLMHEIVAAKFFLAPVEKKIAFTETWLKQFPDTARSGKLAEAYDMLRSEIALTYFKANDKAAGLNWLQQLRTAEGKVGAGIKIGSYLLSQDEKAYAGVVESKLRPMVDSVSNAFKKDSTGKDTYNTLMPVYVKCLQVLGKNDRIVYYLQPLYKANGQQFPSDVTTRIMTKPEDYKLTDNLAYTYGMALAATGQSKEAVAVLARMYLTGEETSEKVLADIKDASSKIPGGEAYFNHLTDSVHSYYKAKLTAFAAVKNVDLNALKGRYVLLDFWGSWCRPCRASHPHLKELYAKYKDKGFEIVGIASEHAKTKEDCIAAWKNAIAQDGITWLQVLNNENAVKFDAVKEYSVTAFPTKILLDKDGNIIGRFVGNGNSGEAFYARLAQLLDN